MFFDHASTTWWLALAASIRCEDAPEVGYWLGAPYWGRGFATEAVRAVIDHAFGELQHETLQAGARVSNPASRRVLEKCAFQWTGVRLTRIRAINSAAPVDRFRLDRWLWLSLKAWGGARQRRRNRSLGVAVSLLGLEERRQSGDQRRSEMGLRIRGCRMVHQFPALDQHAGIVERMLEIPPRPHALPKECVAEIGPVALGRTAERGTVGIGGGEHDGVVVG